MRACDQTSEPHRSLSRVRRPAEHVLAQARLLDDTVHPSRRGAQGALGRELSGERPVKLDLQELRELGVEWGHGTRRRALDRAPGVVGGNRESRAKLRLVV